MNKLLLLFCFQFLFQFVFSQIKIEGKIDHYYNTPIRLYQIEDEISKVGKLISENKIDSNGFFKLQANITFLSEGYIEIENKKIYLLLDKGNNLKIKLKSLQNSNYFNSTIHLIKLKSNYNKKLTIKEKKDIFDSALFVFSKKTDLKDSLFEFYFDSLKSSIIQNKESDWLKNYIKNSIYNVELFLKYKTEIEIYKNYLLDSPIQYHNLSYLNLLYNVMINRVNKLFLKSIKYNDERLKSNPKGVLNEILEKDSLFIKRKDIIEYFLLQYGIKHLNSKEIKKENWIQFYSQIKLYSKFNFHKIIATNILNKLKKLEMYSIAPDFKLKNYEGNEISLHQYKGMYVYIQFWSRWDEQSLLDMKLLNRINKKNKRNLQIISICVDKDTLQYKEIVEQNNYRWQFASFNFNFDLLKKYDVYLIPIYFLIDPFGKLVYYPTEPPVRMFQKLMTLDKKK